MKKAKKYVMSDDLMRELVKERKITNKLLMMALRKDEQAQELFDMLMVFDWREAPQEMLEKVDEVANYLGDIAKGRLSQ